MRRVFLAAMALVGLLALPALASDQTPSFAGAPTGWTTDRYQPNSFSDIGTFAGMNNVLGITTTSAESLSSRPLAYQSTFYNTQGMGMGISGGVGDMVSAKLYIPSSWSDASLGARRSDMWLVVNDPAAGSDPHDYPIVGFTNNNILTSYVGFRAWDSQNGLWVNLTGAAVVYDAWNTLGIAYNGTTFEYYINGVQEANIAASPTDTAFDRVLMQVYNFGDPGLSGSPVVNDYTAHWANDVPEPASVVMLAVSVVILLVFVQTRRGHTTQLAA